MANVVSLHAPLDASTRGMISRDRILRMRRGAILVNTVRGALVDEHALGEALHAGHLGGAGLELSKLEVHTEGLVSGDTFLIREDEVLRPARRGARLGARRALTVLS